jgi:ABC-type nitrate/sulfonate/bicarbonate transport system substrate-binding protein
MMNVQARLPQFMSKQVDGISTYWNIDLVQLEYSTKQKFVMLDTAKYGQIVPGLSVVASNNLIERNPDKLKRFLRALRQGFDAANSDVPAATQALRNAWQGGPAEAVVERQVTLSNTTFPVTPGKPRGWVDEALIASALQLLKDAGQITEARPLSTYYTNALIAN